MNTLANALLTAVATISPFSDTEGDAYGFDILRVDMARIEQVELDQLPQISDLLSDVLGGDLISELGSLLPIEDHIDHFVCISEVNVSENPEKEPELRAVFALSRADRDNGTFLEPGTYDHEEGYHADTTTSYSRNIGEVEKTFDSDAILGGDIQDPVISRQQSENAEAYFWLRETENGADERRCDMIIS